MTRRPIRFLGLVVLGVLFPLTIKGCADPEKPVDNPPPEPSAEAPQPLPQKFSYPQAIGVATPDSFAELVGKVKPAVVNIATTKEIKVRRFSPWGGVDPFFRDYLDPSGGRPQAEKQSHSLGTGFLVNDHGDVLTNNHVVEGADEIIVKLDDGRELGAKIVGRDSKLDIALLRLEKSGAYPSANLGDSSSLKVGDWVVAIGNPFGLGHTVTAGIVSAKGRVIGAGPYDDFIQTDAIVASGQGIGFAIPINMVKEILPQLTQSGKVSRGWLGVAIADVTPEEAKSGGVDSTAGALVAEVVPGGPAEAAGIRQGDIILAFDGETLEKSHELPALVARKSPGSEAVVVFLQGGKKFERKVTLRSLDEAEGGVIGGAGGEVKGLFGLTVRDLNPSERQSVQRGVIVTGVERGSLAESAGLQEGDLLIELNGRPIRSAGEFKEKLDSVRQGEVVRLGLARGPYMYYFAFRKE